MAGGQDRTGYVGSQSLVRDVVRWDCDLSATCIAKSKASVLRSVDDATSCALPVPTEALSCFRATRHHIKSNATARPANAAPPPISPAAKVNARARVITDTEASTIAICNAPTTSSYR